MRIRMLRQFIRLEASAGIILFSSAVLAIAVDNSAWSSWYQQLQQLTLRIQLGSLVLAKPLVHWVDDGLMAIFFLLVGLEIKREMIAGELSSARKVLLPLAASIGGMLGPAVVYCAINWGHAFALRGWAIPTATDIAFALGILALLGSRIPASLKIFLTALAIFDDIGGISIIAGYYTQHIAWDMLWLACGCVAILWLLNRFAVMRLAPYFLVGLVLWWCVVKSGVHATLAGIILALMIPLRNPSDPQHSPLRQLEHKLHPYVAFFVLPLFAFFNAGVSFADLHMYQLWQPIPLGIAVGLCVGNPLAIWFSSWLAIRCGIARKPYGSTWLGVFGIAMIAGVGFTMSLFIGGLAFQANPDPLYLAYVRIGVIEGSLIAGVLGYCILRFGRCRNGGMLQET